MGRAERVEIDSPGGCGNRLRRVCGRDGHRLTAPRSGARPRRGSPRQSARPRDSGGCSARSAVARGSLALRRGDPVFVRHPNVGAFCDRSVDPVGRGRRPARGKVDKALRPDHDADPLTGPHRQMRRPATSIVGPRSRRTRTTSSPPASATPARILNSPMKSAMKGLAGAS